MNIRLIGQCYLVLQKNRSLAEVVAVGDGASVFGRPPPQYLYIAEPSQKGWQPIVNVGDVIIFHPEAIEGNRVHGWRDEGVYYRIGDCDIVGVLTEK